MNTRLNYSQGLGRFVKWGTGLLLSVGAALFSKSAAAHYIVLWPPLHWPHHPKPPCVPEVNTSLVLLPVMVVVLLVASVQALRKRSSQNQ
jgi:hypothetical protein